MTILALDSAGKTAGVALWQNDALLYESYLANGHTHSETLLSLCDAAFAVTGLSPAQIDLYAVNAGPGSFTGLRIGLALAKGLALPHGTPCAGVSTLEALACSAATDGLVATALDARRGEVYCALFRRCAGVVTRLLPDTTLSASEFAQQAAAFEVPVLCMGDGAHLVVQASQTDRVTLYAQPLLYGRAFGVCLAALAQWQAGACVSAAALVPVYHREPQAERERARRLQEGTTA